MGPKAGGPTTSIPPTAGAQRRQAYGPMVSHTHYLLLVFLGSQPSFLGQEVQGIVKSGGTLDLLA